MALPERRRVKSFQDEIIPRYEAQIKEVAGFDIPWQVDYASMDANVDYMAYIESYVFDNVAGALVTICRDDLGKEAVKAGVKGVHIARDPAAIEPDNRVRLADKVLHVLFYWGTAEEMDSYFPTSEAIQRYLEPLI